MPDEARAEVARLATRYALVACISGRTGEDARRMVGVEGIRYVGSHGLELAPDAGRWRDELHAFASDVDWPVEDKGLTVSFHYRQAEDEVAALEYLEEVAEKARRSGLIPRFGRKVLEIRPPVHADKGTAVTTAARRGRPPPGALRRGRLDRRGRLPGPRRPGGRGTRRRLVGRGAERARAARGHRRRLPGGALDGADAALSSRDA